MAIASPNVRDALDSAAKEHGIDPALLRAVAYVESRFNPLAKSDKGALGLCQLMPDTARELGVADPFNPVDNARGAAKYLKRLLARYHSVDVALAAYNWGMGNVAKQPHVPSMPQQVQTYVGNVLQRRLVESGQPPPLPLSATPLALPLHSLRCSHCGTERGAAEMLRAIGTMLVLGADELERRGQPKGKPK